MAAELLDVLRAAGVSPPYILVAHSYGAFIPRELLAAPGPDAVSGIVIVKSSQETIPVQVR